ncbi:hypothetical protein G7046_g358 [Stylonectria norvegica]|nr:hypothetical protein G7046_g358 [Stylonectria norvegica]
MQASLAGYYMYKKNKEAIMLGSIPVPNGFSNWRSPHLAAAAAKDCCLRQNIQDAVPHAQAPSARGVCQVLYPGPPWMARQLQLAQRRTSVLGSFVQCARRLSGLAPMDKAPIAECSPGYRPDMSPRSAPSFDFTSPGSQSAPAFG